MTASVGRFFFRATCAVLALTALAPLSAAAQSSDAAQNAAIEYPMVGPGVRTRPSYDGSKGRHTEIVPVVRYYGHPLYIRSTRGILEGGARLELAPSLILGAQAAYETGRHPGESDFLRSHNVPGVNPGTSLGMHLETDQKIGPVPVNVIARVRKNMDSERGLQADLRATAGVFAKGPVAAGVFAQATWANGKSTNSIYGVTPAQAPSFGLPAFQAGSGLMFTSIGLIYSIELAQHWVIVGNFEARQLHGDASNSPLAERRESYYAVVGVAYKF
jgi:outer membrane scaffolding protein for murein synthesis (MipA/OmpV family)